MARNDGIDRLVARNVKVLDKDIRDTQAHNEREKEVYSNDDIIPERSYLNIHFKEPVGSYQEQFDQMVADHVISTRGLKKDAVHFDELVFDVNSAYFYNHGGYDYAKNFFEDAYKAAVKIVGGEEYILSAVMHADEINRAMTDALEEDVFHYHLHVVYVPVVEKEILWSKRCKDKSLVGTVKERIMQVSHSKKWQSEPVLDEQGNVLHQSNGKPVLKKSYSVLQDDFYRLMREAGYADVERGEKGSSEEHLTVTQFKVKKEQERLDTLLEQTTSAEKELKATTSKAEQKSKELESLKAEIKVQKTAALSIDEIQNIGKKTITGNVALSPSECQNLKDLAVKGLLAKGEISNLQEQLKSVRKDRDVWKSRHDKVNTLYEQLKKQVQPYLVAMELAPEKVRAFFNEVLARTKEHKAVKTITKSKKHDMEI